MMLKKLAILYMSALMIVGVTGCSQEKIQNVLNGTPNGAPKTATQQLEEQGIVLTENKFTDDRGKVEDIVEMSDNELDELYNRIVRFHIDSDKTVEEFEDFREDFKLYAKAIINKPNAGEKLVSLQTVLDNSKFRLYDTDSDGISDFMEMCVTGTSPLLKTSQGDRMDKQYKYDARFILYLDNGGTLRIINPELANIVLSSIDKGKISPLDGQYVIVNSRVYGSDLDSIRLVTDTDSDVDNQLESVSYLYPISLRITGSSATSIDGSVQYMHKNYASMTNEKSVIFIYGGNNNSSDLLTYLQRTPTSTATAEGGKLYVDMNYKLVFPKRSGIKINLVN